MATLFGPLTLIWQALFDKSPYPLEYSRLSAFQNVSLRLLANDIASIDLPPEQRLKAVDTYISDEVITNRPILRPPSPGYSHHVLCSPHNLGAFEMVMSVSNKLHRVRKTHRWLQLRVTSDIEQLAQAECMVVYLDGRAFALDGRHPPARGSLGSTPNGSHGSTASDSSGTPSEGEEVGATDPFCAQLLRGLRERKRIVLVHEAPSLLDEMVTLARMEPDEPQ